MQCFWSIKCGTGGISVEDIYRLGGNRTTAGSVSRCRFDQPFSTLQVRLSINLLFLLLKPAGELTGRCLFWQASRKKVRQNFGLQSPAASLYLSQRKIPGLVKLAAKTKG